LQIDAFRKYNKYASGIIYVTAVILLRT